MGLVVPKPLVMKDLRIPGGCTAHGGSISVVHVYQNTFRIQLLRFVEDDFIVKCLVHPLGKLQVLARVCSTWHLVWTKGHRFAATHQEVLQVLQVMQALQELQVLQELDARLLHTRCASCDAAVAVVFVGVLMVWLLC